MLPLGITNLIFQKTFWDVILNIWWYTLHRLNKSQIPTANHHRQMAHSEHESEDGKRWGHIRGDLKTPGKYPDSWIKACAGIFQACFVHFSHGISAMKNAWKCLKNLDFSGLFFQFEKGVFKSPISCSHPLPSSTWSVARSQEISTQST